MAGRRCVACLSIQLLLIAAALIVCPQGVLARGGGGHSSSHSSSRAHNSDGVVHVRAYYRKDGTLVQSHTRGYPGLGFGANGGIGGVGDSINENDDADPPPLATFRDNARTAPRTVARTAARSQDSPKLLPAKFTVIFANHSRRDIAGYEDEGDGYHISFVNGGYGHYPAKMVDRFIPIEVTDQPSIEPDEEVTENRLPANPPQEATVKEAIDGDTVRLIGGDKLRFIGVDCPELSHPSKPADAFAQQSRDFTEDVLAAERVRLVYDPANATTGQRDKYGRLLAYVYRQRDGLDFNAELVKKGHARVNTILLFSRNDEFETYERDARARRIGLWGDPVTTRAGANELAEDRDQADVSSTSRAAANSLKRARPTDADPIVYVTKSGKKYHRDGCLSLSKSRIPISLSDAKERYGPCLNCHPPE